MSTSSFDISSIIPTIIEFMLVMMVMKMMTGAMGSQPQTTPRKADTSFKDIKGPYSARQYIGGKVNSAGDIIDSAGNVVGHVVANAGNYAYKGGQYIQKGVNKFNQFLNG